MLCDAIMNRCSTKGVIFAIKREKIINPYSISITQISVQDTSRATASLQWHFIYY